ncbi:MAG: endoglucanase [Alteromonadaceae bacterium]|nr:MAG: endoglucanase [Alteromonadaceae bacterium]
MCQWYSEAPRPVCKNQTSGWGWEDNTSCIGASTCNDPNNTGGGVFEDCGGQTTPTPTATPQPTATPVPTATPQPTATPEPTPVPTTPPGGGVGAPGSCDGYATRFWDCCKPHCGWSGNVPSAMDAMESCSSNNIPLPSRDVGSSCDNGGDAHTCFDLAPFAVSDTLSYGYAATSNGDVCGRCFQIDFTGSSHNSPGDPGSAALLGKTMIVQAINIGFDVGGGQFDIMVPGGGVGAFNACSDQWNVSDSELGAQFGGFLAACKQDLGFNASHTAYKSCVTQRCDNVFGSRGLTELYEGCLWFADWFESADNPALKYKEVACPIELNSGTGMNRSVLNDISASCN